MRRIPLVTAVAILLAATLFPITLFAQANPNTPHVPGEIIVKFKENVNQSEKQQARAEVNGQKIKEWGRIRAELQRIEGMTVEEAIQRLQGHPRIEYVEPNYIVTLNETPNDPLFNQLWGLENTGQTGGTAGADISATNAWDVFTGSNTVVIGVIDTGVDYLHPDLAANMWTNPGEIPGNGIDDDLNGFIDDVHGWDFRNDDNDPMDDHYHGTHCAGTIGAVGNNGIGVAGVSWNVKIMALKFLSASGSGSTADAVDAVEYATQMGVHLTSNSWGGGGFSQALYDAINLANQAGILFVAAAGNSNSNNDVSPHYPSNYDLPNVVSVAATDHNDDLASFSSYGATTVDLGAPGVDILSTVPGNQYGLLSGTSMATPHVAGAFGLVFGRFPAIGHIDAKNLIFNFVDPIPSMAGICVTEGRLNAFFPIADPDSIPPGEILDLAVTGEASNSIEIAWTAPGDDGYSGTASGYDIRYSTSPIDTSNFASATQVTGEPDPGPAGTPESMTVDGLNFSTTYYFAAKARDEFGNQGGLSNVPNGTTLGAPEIDVSPLALTETLLTGATSMQALTLSNLAPTTTLDFDIPLPELITAPSPMSVYVDLAKGEVDTRTGSPVINGFGGPDGYGYRWVDSDEVTGPTFNWVDISGTGTNIISSGDDVNDGPHALGFDFSYYGVTYNSIRVCSNGWLSFNSTSTAYGNQSLPNAGSPTAMIAPFWDDLVIGSGDVFFETDGTRAIVQWDNVSHYDSGGPYTFQAILNADGSIELQYLSMGSPDNSATVGMQNNARTDGLTVAFNTPYVHNNLAVRIESIPQWVTTSPTAGTVFGPGTQNLDVNFDASGLLGGTYDGNIRIYSNDPDENPFIVPVQLTVIGAPDIEVEPLAFDYGETFLGATPTEPFTVGNPGTDTLHVSNVTTTDPAYTPAMTAFAVPPRSSVVLNVTFAPGAVGLYPATMTITSDDPDQPTVNVSLDGEGVEPPAFAVSPTSLTSNLLTGETETQGLTLSNSGGANLEWSAGFTVLPSSQVYSLAAPLNGPDIDSGVEEAQTASGPVQIELNDLTGIDILWDRSHGQTSTSSWTTFIGDLTDRGATVTQNTDPITPALLAGYEVFWSVDLSSSFDPAELAALADWVTAGGGLLLEGDNTSSVTIYNEILTALGAGFSYQTSPDVNTGIATTIYPHPTTQDVTGVYFTAAVASITGSFTAPGEPLVEDASGTVGVAASTLGSGRILGAADEIFQSSRMDDADNRLFGNQVFDWLSGPSFLSLDPTAGIIPPGGSEVIDVTFDATGLFGGRYDAEIGLTTNDPLAPGVTVPATVFVTGAPDIEVEPLALNYGLVYVPYPEVLQFTITNTGTDVLTVTDLISDNPRFQVNFAGITLPLNLNPLQTALVQVGFIPNLPQPEVGTLAVVSNDADEPTVNIAMSGEGLLPPLAGVTPDSMHADLLTGETDVQQLTLSNTGATDLDWNIGLSFQAATAFYTLAAPEPVGVTPDVDSGSPDLSSDHTSPIQAELADLTGIDILWDRSHGQTTTSSWTSIIGDFEARGAVLTVNNDELTPALLAGYDVLWFVDMSSSLSASELTALTNWINTGGSLLLEGDNSSSVTIYNEILTALGAGIDYSTTSGSSGTTANIFPHSTTENVFGIYLTGNIASIPTIAAPGAPLFNDTGGVGAGAYAQIGSGRIIALSDEIFQNSRMDDADNQLFGNQVMDWLSVPVFLFVSPKDGTLPPGGSTIVDVTFDAGGLFGGFYSGVVRVESNDPANGVINVPATMQVTGVARLEWEPEPLDLGDVFIGYPESMDLMLSNVGTDDLHVTAMTPGHPDWSVSPANLTLAPGGIAAVSVTLDPQSTGVMNTMLTIDSNDPDSPHMATLLGSGLVAPVAGVNPDSLHADLLTGELETQQVTLSNTGGSDLTWETALTFFSYVPSQVFTLSTPEFPGTTFDVDTGQPDINSDRTDPIQVELADLTGINIMWDREHGQTSTSSWTTIISDIESRGATVTINTDPWTPALLAGFDVIWSVDLSSSLSASEMAAFINWMNAGGALLLEGDNTSSVTIYNEMLTALGAGFAFQTSPDVNTGDATTIYPHPTTENVNGVYFTAAVASIADGVVAPAEVLIEDSDGVIAGAASEVGPGRIIGIPDEVFQNSRMDDADNQLFGNQVMDWLAGQAFFTVAPESGVVPAGGSALVDVTFDATGLFGGDYSGQIAFLSNDPVNPELVVPATMHVTPVPRVAWEPEPLDFGTLFVGYPESMDLTVSNVGTAHLSVTDMIPDLADWSVSPTALELDPGQSALVSVTFDPQSDGNRNALLSIESNDPDSPHNANLWGSGLYPPIVGTSPDSIVGAAPPGGQKTKTLTVCNTGGSDLEFTASANTTGGAAVTVHDYVTIPKETDTAGGELPESDPRSILGTGGPDAFGYTWIDSDEAGGPVYDWVDISGIGTPTDFPSYDIDGTFGPYPIGFNFSFYGNTFSEFYVCNNGWISFTNGSSQAWGNQPLPNAGGSTPENMLAAWWDDNVYDESDGSYIVYHNDGSRLIIEFFVRRIAQSTPPFYNFQMILYPNGNIVYQYKTLGTQQSSSTIGIQNATRDDGLTVNHNNSSYPHENLAILFSAGPDWLTVSPEAGVVPPGECMDLTVTMNAADLTEGDYYGSIQVVSNDPATPLDETPVTFHVGLIDAADMDVDPNTLNLGSNGKWVTGSVELPLGYDPNDIVPETVTLNGVPADPTKFTIGDFNENSIPDATLKFSRSAFESTLVEGDSVKVVMTGEIEDIIWFTACDTIRVIQPNVLFPNGGETVAMGYPVDINWENPVGWMVHHADLYYSGDDGATWEVIALGVTGTTIYSWTPDELTETALVRVYLFDNKGVMGYDSSDQPFTVSGAVLDADGRLPVVHVLRQNAPNPFHSSTRITFDLPQQEHVDLRIYNVQGRLIKILKDNELPRGSYEVYWDGQGDTGVPVASGIYFYHLRAGKFVATKRMTLIK